MGLNGSKSILTFFSLPSSVTMVPQYTTRPLGGTKTEQNISMILENIPCWKVRMSSKLNTYTEILQKSNKKDQKC